MTFHKLLNDGGMSFAEVKGMTYPQMICKFADKPPETSRKVTSYAAYEASIREQEAAWRAKP
jgi:hypothetical protein